jgi:hypothetical protein
MLRELRLLPATGDSREAKKKGCQGRVVALILKTLVIWLILRQNQII